MRTLFLIPALLASSAMAQTDRAPSAAMRPVPAPPSAVAQPAANANFSATCSKIVRVTGGSNFSFGCLKSDGTQQIYSVATGSDNAGDYPVGHDSQTGSLIADLYRATAIAQTVTGFMAIKAASPSSDAVLQVDGFISKLPAAYGAPVVTVATIVIK